MCYIIVAARFRVVTIASGGWQLIVIAMTTKTQYDLNKQIESFVLQTNSFREKDLSFLNQYAGFGGMWNMDQELSKERGLYEYYTPIPIVEKMVGLAMKYGYTAGPVLEPSCGIGRFLHYFSPKEEVVGIEIDKVSWTIAKANFPNFKILHQSFNQLFVDRRGNSMPFKPHYKLIIGNPPYGDFKGRYTAQEKRLTKSNTYVDYFITRGLDLLLKGGLLIYIIPSAFLEGEETAVKSLIAQKAELLDAYRLPKGIFDQTDIGTDIVVFKKK